MRYTNPRLPYLTNSSNNKTATRDDFRDAVISTGSLREFTWFI